jgi:hypothetical protein
LKLLKLNFHAETFSVDWSHATHYTNRKTKIQQMCLAMKTPFLTHKNLALDWLLPEALKLPVS